MYQKVVEVAQWAAEAMAVIVDNDGQAPLLENRNRGLIRRSALGPAGLRKN